MPVLERMTAEEFLALPEPETGGPRLSLVAGEVVVNEPTPLHSFVDGDLAFALSAWARAEPGRGRVLRPIDVLLDERNVFGPAILWYSEGRAPARHASPMPDLVAEIRSPSTWRYDIGGQEGGL